VAMVRRGENEEARLTQLYKKYGPLIYARCRRLLPVGSAAEDAAQETFVRVWRHLERAPNEEEALAWIWRIATNLCLNEIRDGRLRPGLVADIQEIVVDIPSHIDEERLADRDLVRRLVARAPEATRAVAWLYHVDGLEQDEVALMLGISRRTVVNRLNTFVRNARKFFSRSAA